MCCVVMRLSKCVVLCYYFPDTTYVQLVLTPSLNFELLCKLFVAQPNTDTRRLLVEEGGFKYDSDSYADDLPYWTMEHETPHLIIPYSLSENDMKFVAPNNYSHGSDFFTHLKQTLL